MTQSPKGKTRPGLSPAMDNRKQYQRFLEAAREHGCDPADPGILDVLRSMAARPHQPRRKSGGKTKGKETTTEA